MFFANLYLHALLKMERIHIIIILVACFCLLLYDASALTQENTPAIYTVDDITYTLPMSQELPAVDLSVGAAPGSRRTIGDRVTFEICLRIFEDVQELQLKDVLPKGTKYLGYEGDLANPKRPDSQTLLWTLGNIGSSELRIKVHALVVNTISNQNGTVLTNTAQAVWKDPAGDTCSINATASITVVEPEIKIAISANRTNVQAGDIVEQIVTLSNTGTSDAYDVNLTETIADRLEILNAEPAPLSVDGNVIRFLYDRIPAGSRGEMRLITRVKGSAVLGEDLSCTAAVMWTSLPGDDPNERRGGGARLDNYDETDTFKITVSGDVSISKTPDFDRICTIGDSATYKIHLNLPRAVIKDLVVIDILPNGTVYDPASLKISGSNPLDVALPTGDANTLVLSFGDLNNTDDRDLDLWYDAIIANSKQNRNGVVLQAGTAKVQWRSGDGNLRYRTDSNSGCIEIVEPLLCLEKRSQISGAIVGDELVFQLDVYHDDSSRADAYDIVLRDVVPDNVSFLRFYSSMPMNFEQVGEDLIWTAPKLRRGERAYVIYAISTNITGCIGGRSSLTWTSREGDDPNERSGRWTDLDCYNRTADAYIVVDDLRIECEPATLLKRCPGDYVEMRFYGDLPDLSGAWLNLSLPGMHYDPASLSCSFSFSKEISQGDDLSLYLGDVQAGHLDLSLRASVDASSLESPLMASLELSWLSTGERRSISTRTGEIEIVEPRLNVRKSPTVKSMKIGETLRYRISIEHSGDSDAWDVILKERIPDCVEILPESLEYDGGSIELCDGSLIWRIDRLPKGENLSLKYDIIALSDGHEISNSYLSWSSIKEDRIGRREYTASVKSEIVIGSCYLSVDAPECAYGGFVNYTLRYRNIAERDIKDVVVKAVYDPLLTFVSSSPLPCDPARSIWSGCALPGILHPGEEGLIRITTKNSKVSNGTIVETRFILSFDGHIENISKRTVIISPVLAIDARGEPESVGGGGIICYTVKYKNLGKAEATNLTLRGEFPPGMEVISATRALISERSGEILFSIPGVLMPGEEGMLEINALLKAGMDDDTIDALFILESSEAGPVTAKVSTYVRSITRKISIAKRASCHECRRGESIGYTITVCNPSTYELTDVVIKENPDPRLVIEYANPPRGPDGLWHIDKLGAGECRNITVIGRVPRSDIQFEMTGRIEGEGFARTYRDCAAYIDGFVLRNCVLAATSNLSARDCAAVNIMAEEGAQLNMRGHGSGRISSEESVATSTADRSIRVLRAGSSERERYDEKIYGREVTFSSSWNDRIDLVNRQSRFVISSNADIMNHSMNALADPNGTAIAITAEFNGSSSISVKKLSSILGNMSSFDSLSGSAKISAIFEEHGEYGAFSHSYLGNGTLRVRRYDESRRSHIWGAGSYLSQGLTTYNYIEDHLQAESNRSGALWRAGAWIEGGRGLREEFSALRIDKETRIGRRGLDTRANFSGMAILGVDLRDAYLSDIYIGNYTLQSIVSVPASYRHGTAHMNITIDSYKESSDIVCFRIKIHNDGVKDLAPVYVFGILAEGSEILSAYPVPFERKGRMIKWMLDYIKAGDAFVITLRIDVRGREYFDGAALKEIKALGRCDGYLPEVMARRLVDGE